MENGNHPYMRDLKPHAAALGGIVFLAVAAVVGGYFCYTQCRIEVPAKHIAVLIKKTGDNLTNDLELATGEGTKGVQATVLPEGRYFYSPYDWDWEVIPQVEIPQGKLGVLIRLHGEDPSYGTVIAWEEGQKGIVPDVLRPGRYPFNAWILGPKRAAEDIYAYHVELHNPVTIPAGYKGVVTNLSGNLPGDPNVLMVAEGERGVQSSTLEPATHYVNPYVTRINLVDCRSQRFNLSDGGEMGFPSKDGFWVTLDGIIEFRVKPEEAARVFVTYNDVTNDEGSDAQVDKEIINKVILPNARSFCRLQGSNHSGREFISGETRIAFQKAFQTALAETCESQGIEIIQALITRINPPQKIAGPVRDRQIALQQEKQYGREILQQESEKELAIEQELVKQKQALVDADREVVKLTTEAQRRQEVALIEANQRLAVAEFELKAAQDLASATLARGKAAADVVEFENEAEAAGWRKAVEAFQGDGDRYARWVMLKKLAPSFKRMMVNTADSPIMDIFKSYNEEVPNVTTE